jgi:tRNA(fMet)-specific endonuclease VapC
METLSTLDIAIPSMVKAELYYGALKSEKKSKVISSLERFLSPFEVIALGDKEIMAYARIRANLKKAVTIIGPNDLIIAAITLSHGATLVTHNKNEFERVEDLLLEDWTE